MRRFAIPNSIVVVAILVSGCSLFADPDLYDPSEGGWVLYAQNDFSSSATTALIPELDTWGDASAAVGHGSLRFAGQSDPQDQMWLKTTGGLFETTVDYKIYVEPLVELMPGSQYVALTSRRDPDPTTLTAYLRADELELRADGGSADEVIGEVTRNEDLDTHPFAFELIIESGEVTVRLINLEDSRVSTQISGALGSLEYIDGHDLWLGCGYVGSIILDNYRIYTKEPLPHDDRRQPLRSSHQELISSPSP